MEMYLDKKGTIDRFHILKFKCYSDVASHIDFTICILLHFMSSFHCAVAFLDFL